MKVEKTNSGTPIIRYGEEEQKKEWKIPDGGNEEHINMTIEHIEKILRENYICISRDIV